MKYIKIGGCFQVWEDFKIQTIIIGYTVETDLFSLAPDGMLTIRRYFTWDGPTGARNTKTFVKGSCAHDIFCIMINYGFLPKEVQCQADEQMLMINRNQKMWKPRRIWTYMVVRYHMITKKKPSRAEVLEVP